MVSLCQRTNCQCDNSPTFVLHNSVSVTPNFALQRLANCSFTKWNRLYQNPFFVVVLRKWIQKHKCHQFFNNIREIYKITSKLLVLIYCKIFLTLFLRVKEYFCYTWDIAYVRGSSSRARSEKQENRKETLPGVNHVCKQTKTASTPLDIYHSIWTKKRRSKFP